MIIESIYQGKIPIRRVYLNGHVVWKPPAYLPPYLVYLDTQTLGEQGLSKISIMQGNLYIDDAAKMYMDGSPIGADLFLVNHDVSEKYDAASIQSTINVLHLAQIASEFIEGPDLFTSKYGMSLDTMVGDRYANELVDIFSSNNGLSVTGAILSSDLFISALENAIINGTNVTSIIPEHLQDLYVAMGCYHTGRVYHAKPGEHEKLNSVTIDYYIAGIEANAKPVEHEESNDVTIDYHNSGLSADAKPGAHEELHNVTADYSTRGTVAIAKPKKHRSSHNASAEYHTYGTPGSAQPGDYKSVEAVGENHELMAADVGAEIGNLSRSNSVTVSSDSYISDSISPGAVHDITSNLLCIPEGGAIPASLHPVLFTSSGDGCDSELQVSRTSFAPINRDVIATITRNSTITMHAMYWLYPVQTGSDLYIPQVYDNGVLTGAVQNGSELVM